MWRAALLVLVGCGGVAFEDFADEVRDAQCEFRVRCGLLANMEDCRAYFARIAVGNDSLAMAIDMGKVRYDEDAAEECIEDIASASCDAFSDFVEICRDVYSGTVADGGACAFGAECKSLACAVPDCTAACCMGTCIAERPPPGIGQACTFECIEGAYCANGTCQAQLPAGAACSDYFACEQGTYCKGLTTTASGTCSTIPRLGEPCDELCREIGARCKDGTCQMLGLPGDPCTVNSDCSYYYECSAMQCARQPTLGMPCTTVCYDASYCSTATMTCEAQQANGAACVNNDQCASHYCGESTCADVPICL